MDARGGAVGTSPVLIDSFQRRHNYLRISLTERCNLRCTSLLLSVFGISPSPTIRTHHSYLCLIREIHMRPVHFFREA